MCVVELPAEEAELLIDKVEFPEWEVELLADEVTRGYAACLVCCR